MGHEPSIKQSRLIKPIFLSVAALVVLSIVVTYYAALVDAPAAQRMAQKLQELKELSNVGISLQDTETGQRGYLLTGENRYLEPYDAGLSQLQAELQEIQELAAAGELPKSKVDQLVALTRQKLDELDQTIRARKEKGLEFALAIVRSGRGKLLMDQIRLNLADLQSHVQAGYEASRRSSESAARLRTLVFFAAGLLEFMFLLWAYRRISLEIEQRGRLAGIVESSDDAIISKTLDGIITSWNAGAEKVFGYSAKEMVGKPMLILFPPERVQEESEILARIARGENIDHFETVRRRKDGGHIHVSVTISPIRDSRGKITGASKIARNITDRKLADAKLQAQLGRLALLHQITRAIGERQDLQSILQVTVRSLEDNLPLDFGCICIYDQAAYVLKVICVGVKSEPMAIELAMKEQAIIPIDENGLSRCVHGQLVYEPDTSQSKFPFPQRLSHGGLRALVIAPLLVESQVFGILVASRRAAQSFSSGECEFLKQLSEHVALASHHSQLYGALQQAYDDLRQTQQAITQQERLRALGQMASGIAHDINNAISPISLYTESLLENEQNLSARGREYLETISHAINDVAATVGRLREFYRQRETNTSLTALNLNRLAPQVMDMTRARWSDMPQQRGVVIHFTTDLAPDLPDIMGVESEIREALINLVFNGVDAMPEGGRLTLRTKVVETSPDKAGSSSSRFVQVEVRDTGVGMSEETRRRCLEPFFTTKGERGTGLGLAMVYGTIKRHSADIEIESEPGVGTTIRLSFAVPMGTIAPEANAPKPHSTPSGLRILVIDDDPLLIKSLRDTLEMEGHFVITANGGQNGIDTFRQAHEIKNPFAVVFTDLGMPNVDGRKVAQTIKNLSPSTPVIMLTGWGQRLMAEGDIPPHVNRVLNKPPKMRELREALAECCLSNGV